MPNGVHAHIPSASVRCSALHDNVDPNEAFVRRHYRKACRLGHDRGVSAYTLGYQRARAETRVLLVDNRGHDDLAVQRSPTRACRAGGRGAHRRDSALHVGRATTIEASFAYGGIPWWMRHSLYADDVDVSVEH